MRKILIVDDIALNRAILEDILEEDYEVESVQGGAEALELLGTYPNDYGLVLLDLVMPDVTGFDVLEEMNRWNLLDSVPVIVISGEDARDVETKTLALHATDFVHKPFDDQVVQHRVRNVFDLYTYKRSLEDKVAEQTESLRKSNMRLREQAQRIQEFNDNITSLLGTVVEYRDEGSGEHISRVKVYTRLLIEEVRRQHPEYELTTYDTEMIARASVLHDVGKIAVPDSILLKPGRLTHDEYQVMKNHTIMGGEILLSVRDAWDADFGEVAYQICRHHHERWDGNGYPDKLKGDDIPISAQCVAVADVFDALTSERPYKKAFAPQEAYNMIEAGECGVFAPQMLKCLAAVKEQFFETALGTNASGANSAVLKTKH